jgi:hypothetical protein
MVAYLSNAWLMSTFPDELRLRQTVQLTTPGATQAAFSESVLFWIDEFLKQFFLPQKLPHLWKRKQNERVPEGAQRLFQF